jgi:carbamoyl-phosphate synthase small subunit
VVALDFGAKRNILRCLVDAGCKVTAVPASTSAREVLAKNPDGVFLSNGPGDPAAVTYATATIRELLGKKPIFGICLGHQLLALALGAKTYKLKFGHRGLNQPVKDLATGRVEITTQNHGFVVDVDSISGIAKTTHLHLNDGTSEGLEAPEARAFSVQYHPEAAAGPHDALYLFDRFVKSMERG